MRRFIAHVSREVGRLFIAADFRQPPSRSGVRLMALSRMALREETLRGLHPTALYLQNEHFKCSLSFAG